MTYLEKFIESIEVPNTLKVVKYVFPDTNINIEKYDIYDLESFILKSSPNSPKTITTICYVLGLYGRWLQEQNIETDLYNIAARIDKKALWKKVKKSAPKKFISYEKYLEIINDISRYEEFNSLYFCVLLRAVYEGVYSNSMNVLKNLRISDISNNEISLNEDDGTSYTIEVSEDLIRDLKILANIDKWERRNRYGICRVNMRGVHSDSIFKIENRTTAADDAHKFAIYSRLRKISNEYLGYTLSPYQIYISGIMNRIKINLEKEGIQLDEAFSHNNRNRVAHNIVVNELERSHFDSGISNFREIVKGHIDIF